MTLNPKWIPMHWPCGPLPAARLAAEQTLSADLKESLAAWASPKSLEIIQGSPVNCLVVPWAEGVAEDRDQQQLLGPLIRAGGERGISFVGAIAGTQNVAAAISSGMQAGLAGFMVESLEGLPKDAPVILRTPRSGVPWEALTPVHCLTGNLWPRLGMDTVIEGDEANAGPTGVPWVNSNGWLSMLAMQLVRPKRRSNVPDPRKSVDSSYEIIPDAATPLVSRSKTIWLEYDPPESSDLDHPAGYALAVADSYAYGSRWVVSLDDHLRSGLTRMDPRAKAIWEEISSALKFFQANAAWDNFEPQGALVVVSDFRGDNEFLATETLNLLARRHVQYKIMGRSAAHGASLRGLRTILWMDSADPGAEVKSRFRTFVVKGGLLIAPTLWWSVKSSPRSGGLLDHFQVYRFGLGRIAVPREGMTDPYEVAFDTHMLMSRRSDMVRIFNITACNTLLTAEAQSGRRLVQVLNYGSAGRTDPASVWLRDAHRTARFWNLGAAEPVTVRGIPSRIGWEFQLPFISTYGALEFDLWGTKGL